MGSVLGDPREEHNSGCPCRSPSPSSNGINLSCGREESRARWTSAPPNAIPKAIPDLTVPTIDRRRTRAHVLSRLVMAAYVGKAEDPHVKPRAEAELTTLRRFWIVWRRKPRIARLRRCRRNCLGIDNIYRYNASVSLAHESTIHSAIHRDEDRAISLDNDRVIIKFAQLDTELWPRLPSISIVDALEWRLVANVVPRKS
ncbi:hypothetical protein HN011_002387 [Eciton burchellii]|nr:hypothetical protein HN011_002387 [Eciton burchellii]